MAVPFNFYAYKYLPVFLLILFSCTQKEQINSSNTSRLSGIMNYNPDNQSSEKLKYISGIRSILQDKKGNYWIGSHGEGVCVYDGKMFTYFTMDHGLSNNQVRTIQEDKNGVIWFGTGNGVSSFDGEKIVNHTQNNKVPVINIKRLGMWNLIKDDLWFNAGNNPGVYRYDGQQLTYLPLSVEKENQSFDTFGVTGLSRKRENKLWIATYTAVFGYDGNTFETIDDESLGYKKPPGKLHVRSILEDSKGRLWIGNNGIGVLLKDGDKIINFSEDQQLVHPNSSGGGATSPPGTLEHVFAITEDSQGNIWFGDRDTGAWKYDGQTIKNYTIKDGIPSKHIWQIYENNAKELLLVLAEGSVYRYTSGKFDRMF